MANIDLTVWKNISKSCLYKNDSQKKLRADITLFTAFDQGTWIHFTSSFHEKNCEILRVP